MPVCCVSLVIVAVLEIAISLEQSFLHMRLFAPFANTGLIGNVFVCETISVDVIKWNNEAYSFLQYLSIIKY